ncbi:MAG: hypothetical protein ACTSYA_06990 [Candidatus Kariarchaeaceae archaeon]
MNVTKKSITLFLLFVLPFGMLSQSVNLTAPVSAYQADLGIEIGSTLHYEITEFNYPTDFMDMIDFPFPMPGNDITGSLVGSELFFTIFDIWNESAHIEDYNDTGHLVDEWDYDQTFFSFIAGFNLTSAITVQLNASEFDVRDFDDEPTTYEEAYDFEYLAEMNESFSDGYWTGYEWGFYDWGYDEHVPDEYDDSSYEWAWRDGYRVAHDHGSYDREWTNPYNPYMNLTYFNDTFYEAFDIGITDGMADYPNLFRTTEKPVELNFWNTWEDFANRTKDAAANIGWYDGYETGYKLMMYQNGYDLHFYWEMKDYLWDHDMIEYLEGYESGWRDGYNIGYNQGWVDYPGYDSTTPDFGEWGDSNWDEGYADGMYQSYWAGYPDGQDDHATDTWWQLYDDGYGGGVRSGAEEAYWQGFNTGGDDGFADDTYNDFFDPPIYSGNDWEIGRNDGWTRTWDDLSYYEWGYKCGYEYGWTWGYDKEVYTDYLIPPVFENATLPDVDLNLPAGSLIPIMMPFSQSATFNWSMIDHYDAFDRHNSFIPFFPLILSEEDYYATATENTKDGKMGDEDDPYAPIFNLSSTYDGMIFTTWFNVSMFDGDDGSPEAEINVTASWDLSKDGAMTLFNIRMSNSSDLATYVSFGFALRTIQAPILPVEMAFGDILEYETVISDFQFAVQEGPDDFINELSEMRTHINALEGHLFSTITDWEHDGLGYDAMIDIADIQDGVYVGQCDPEEVFFPAMLGLGTVTVPNWKMLEQFIFTIDATAGQLAGTGGVLWDFLGGLDDINDNFFYTLSVMDLEIDMLYENGLHYVYLATNATADGEVSHIYEAFEGWSTMTGDVEASAWAWVAYDEVGVLQGVHAMSGVTADVSRQVGVDPIEHITLDAYLEAKIELVGVDVLDPTGGPLVVVSEFNLSPVVFGMLLSLFGAVMVTMRRYH